jgi:pyridoxine/pyridoxamine 5'-phosphate oxidase
MAGSLRVRGRRGATQGSGPVIFDRAPDDPLTIFSAWLKDAEEQEPNDHNAVTVACVGADGMPSVRMVLLGFRVLYQL